MDAQTLDKRKLLWVPFALLIAFLTFRAVLAQSKTFSVSEVFITLRHASPFWMTVALACMAGFIIFEALSLLCILRNLNCPRSFFQGVLYSAADQFFSAITPSATGGQPASALFMRSDGISGAVMIVTLLLNLVLYTAATLLVGVVCLVARLDVFLRLSLGSKALVVFGMLALAALAVLFYGLLKRGELIYRTGGRFYLFLNRLHLLRNPGRRIMRLKKTVEEFRLCSDAITGKTGAIAAAFLFDLAQRVAQISVTLALHYAIKDSPPVNGWDLWVVQALAQIGSNCVPIPGGMGAADYLMLDGFQSLFRGDYIYHLQILSRSVSFYMSTILSGLISLAGYLAIRIRKQRQKER